MFAEEQGESDEALHVDEVDLDEDDDLAFVHAASGKCDACTHLLHYIPITPENFQAQSFLKIYLCITDSDEVTDFLFFYFQVNTSV